MTATPAQRRFVCDLSHALDEAISMFPSCAQVDGVQEALAHYRAGESYYNAGMYKEAARVYILGLFELAEERDYAVGFQHVFRQELDGLVS